MDALFGDQAGEKDIDDDDDDDAEGDDFDSLYSRSDSMQSSNVSTRARSSSRAALLKSSGPVSLVRQMYDNMMGRRQTPSTTYRSVEGQ